MTELFLHVINGSISASWLILAVLLLRFILKKAPRWIPVLLWGMVAFRLLCPLSIENPLSLILREQVITDLMMSSPGPEVQIGNTPSSHTENVYFGGVPSEDSVQTALHTDNDMDVMSVLAIVWIGGVCLLTLYFVFSCFRLHRQVSTAVVLRDNIFQSETVSSPFVLGVVRPRIYLPFGISIRNLEYVISHERAHIRRGDHWWKPLGFLLLTVHWFNPLMWLSYVLLCRDIELACDERVIKELNRSQRADYSQALLACSVSHRSIAACPLAFGEVGVKERVKSVLNYRKPAFWVIGAAVIGCAAVAVFFLTDPVRKQDTLVWAQGLSADDIASADLVVYNQTYDRQYKNLSKEEIAAMVALINGSKGRYLPEHEDLNGGSIYFYITMQDGTTHDIGNIGNTYLNIDQDYYEARYGWLTAWDDDFGEGNAPLPEGYLSGTPVSDSEPEPVPEETSPMDTAIGENAAALAETIVWEDADLDRDGEAETIRVREEDGSGGQIYELEVVKKDGTVLWNTVGGTVHTGQGSILLYQEDGEDYLIEYNPTIYQGIGSYTCRIFTLEGGRETEINFWEAQYELSSLQITSRMNAFAERVNDFLRHSTVLLSTVEGQLVVGPRAAEEIPLIYPVQFWPMDTDFSSFIGGDALEDFLPLEFLFASGAGAWGTHLTLYPDGHFEGDYGDWDAVTGPEYPHGMVYYCKFSGQFADITKVSAYAYTMRLEELTYESEVDREWIEDEVLYIGSDAHGVTGGEEFVLYLPGTPLEELDEEFLSWWPENYLRRQGSVSILSSYGIHNVNTGEGFFSSWLQ